MLSVVTWDPTAERAKWWHYKKKLSFKKWAILIVKYEEGECLSISRLAWMCLIQMGRCVSCFCFLAAERVSVWRVNISPFKAFVLFCFVFLKAEWWASFRRTGGIMWWHFRPKKRSSLRAKTPRKSSLHLGITEFPKSALAPSKRRHCR